MDKVYKIKRAITLPLIIAVVLSVPVFGLSLRTGAPTAKLLWTLALMLLFYLFAFNRILQRLAISEDALEFRGIGGKRHLPFNTISAIDGVTMGTRQFIVITAAKRSFHFSNSLDGFEDLAVRLQQTTAQDIQGAGLAEVIAAPARNRRDSFAPWLAVLVMLLLLASTI